MDNPSHRSKLTFWQILQRFPPYYVRLLAKTGHSTALTDADIAIVSGIELNRVRQIKVMTSWEYVTLGELQRYTMACNFDPTRTADRNRISKYDHQWKTRKTIPFHYLRKCPKWESEILPVLTILQSELSKRSLAA